MDRSNKAIYAAKLNSSTQKTQLFSFKMSSTYCSSKGFPSIKEPYRSLCISYSGASEFTNYFDELKEDAVQVVLKHK
ncbi:hypothetical protein [Bacillus sp. MSP13]|uniref:hypothetical protein n=1 Tax=Bacillus sp. MSP13 TaxID=1071061 RepID=UPI0018CDB156|nr:hypothetical protein [Bacillus sp. MSP13]